jgi:ABC-type Fe3+/spermidine/putrescine transport system ATPase subunit
MARLIVRDLDKWFGPRGLLRNLSFEANSGEAVALYGPSGCGKSTLLRILAGLDAADHGEVVFDGETLNRGRETVPPEKRGVAMVFQHLALWPHMTVEGHLDFVMRETRRGRAERESIMGAVLERFGLSALADVRPARLSGGEQQRLALARALAVEAQLLLLDEPFSHLDEAWRARGVEVLRERKRAGVVLVVATHHREDLRDLSERVLHIAPDGTGHVERARIEPKSAVRHPGRAT